MLLGQCPIYNGTLKIFVYLSSTDICVYNLIETRLRLFDMSSVRCVSSWCTLEIVDYKRDLISLQTNISVLDVHTNGTVENRTLPFLSGGSLVFFKEFVGVF